MPTFMSTGSTPVTLADTAYTELPITPLDITVDHDGRALIILQLDAVFTTGAAGATGQVAVMVDDIAVAEASITSQDWNVQDVPTLFTIERLTAGRPHTVKAAARANDYEIGITAGLHNLIVVVLE